MRKVISMVLCLMLVLGLATTAFAATVDNQTTHAYEAYQIFKGSQSGSDSSLGSIVWGEGVDGDKLLADLQNENVGKVTAPYFPATVTTAESVAAILADPATPIDVVRHFAQLAYNNKTNKTADIGANDSSVELPAGYYLLVDVSIPGEKDALNPALLQVTNAGPITIKKKYDVPEHEKTVKQDDVVAGDTNAYGKMEDSPIGGDVEFQLKAEMPLNMEGFEKYTMTFHDDLSEGLTYADSVILTVGGNVVPAEQYKVVENPENCEKDGKIGEREYKCDFHVVIPNVMEIEGYAPGCEIVVTYHATLNEKAVINGEGNPNSYRLEYANDPNWDPDAAESDDQPTGVTPWDEVKVYTTEVQLTKVDGNTDAPLAGAEFTLTGDTIMTVKVTKTVFTNNEAESTDEAKTKYWELNDGTYTTTDPTTAGVDQSAYKDINTIYYTKVVEEFVEKKENVKIAATTGPDGVVKFSGLGEGTYEVEETKVPAGYNGLKEKLKLTIVFHEADGRYEYSWSGGAIGTTSSLQVDNMKGSVLPETGGMGTTLFYIIGGLMVAASAVLLITKRRMTVE